MYVSYCLRSIQTKLLVKTIYRHKYWSPYLRSYSSHIGSFISTTIFTTWHSTIRLEHAYITPIHKKGSKADTKNHRPVSLTSLVCKIMEHVLLSQIMHHLNNHHILLDTQFGFHASHSCETQLLLTVDDLAKAIDHSLQADAAILDFAKTFDKVSHHHLIHKLNYYGIWGILLNWLKSFLHDCSQEVVVEGAHSTSCLKGPCSDQFFFCCT